MGLPTWVSRPFQAPQIGHSDRDRYEECPLCRHGTLTTLMMMDAMSCDFCRHIFSIDVTQPMVQSPILRVEDSSHALTWQWTGERWRALPQAEKPLILWLWIFCVALVVIPSILMGLAVQLFPATSHARGDWFPIVWLYLTIGSHLFTALWFLAEHYQWPLYHRFKFIWSQRFSET